MLTKQEIRQLQEKESKEELTKTSRELVKARMEHSSKTLKETHRLSGLKKQIARIKTIEMEAKKEQATKSKKKSS